MSRPVRITIFNHKGGVGKTTLTANIAFALASLDKSILLVDSDPQCNLTSYLLSDDVVDELLNHSGDTDGQTIWTALKPVFDNVGVGRLVNPTPVGNIALLPGDIKLSEFEEFLDEAWNNSFKRRLGALRATSSVSNMVSLLNKQKEYDFIFYDAGPNIGPLNRILLLDSDFFIVPVACDLFSVRALATLGQTIKKWIMDAHTIRQIAPDKTLLLKAAPKFLGYMPQRFKIYGRTMTKQASFYLRRIKSRVHEDVASVLHQIDKDLAPKRSADPVVGTVRDFTTIVQKAQQEGVAIWECSSTNTQGKEAARKSFFEIASRIIDQTAIR